MCGIVAVVALENLSVAQVKSQSYRRQVASEVNQSLEKIDYRGPDARGQWVSDDNRIALGQNRLAIKDLSDAGHQPLHTPDGTVHAVVNGEIYDYDVLRQQLSPNYQFQSSSDSELVIALYQTYGLGLFSYLRGEFAFCLYDEQRQIFLAARDRFGIKPLFWTVANDRLMVASEIKAFLPLGLKPHWDVRSILEDGWFQGDRTLFKGVKKIQPSSYMTSISFELPSHASYWEQEFPDKHIEESRGEEEMVEGVRSRLYSAVQSRMQADVPIGVYLSGGIDSAAVAGIAADIQKKQRSRQDVGNSPQPLTCFNVGFDADTVFDEMDLAKRTAAHLGLPFVSKRLDEATFASNFEATFIQCEHHNMDLNSVAKFVLSKMTRDAGFKVILTGEGADESLGGYSWVYADFVREPDHSYGSDKLSPQERADLTLKVERETDPIYHGSPQGWVAGGHSLARRMLNGVLCPWTLTTAPLADWTKNSYGKVEATETRAALIGAKALDSAQNHWHPLHIAQHIWIRSILPNLIMTCLGDRMEMAHSVEGRQPFLDHDLVRYINFLPPSIKIKHDPATSVFREKWVLYEAVKPYVTREMYDREKWVFSSPWKYPAGGPIHKLLTSLLTRKNLDNLGFVDTETALDLLERAFSDKDEHAIRPVFILAQWIVLARAFDVPPAVAPDAETTHSASGRETIVQSAISGLSGIIADQQQLFCDWMTKAKETISTLKLR